jgi:hypothetical protein
MSLTVKAVGEIDAQTARAVIDGLSAPAPREKIIEWLTVCAVKTASAKDDDMTSDLKLRVFADDLLQYPGDIVRHVLKEWPSRSKWFPVWKELEDQVQEMAGLRPQIVDKVRSRISRPTQIQASGEGQ